MIVVGVIAPYAGGKGVGVTTIASLVSLGLGDLSKKVLLGHTEAVTQDYYTYLGLPEFADKTAESKQLVKLIGIGGMQPSEVKTYCREIGPNVDLFTNNRPDYTEEEMYEYVKYVVGVGGYDVYMFDIGDIEQEAAKEVVRQADVLIYPVEQNIKSLGNLKARMEGIRRLSKGKRIIYVVNKYEANAGTLKGVIKYLGINADLLSRLRGEGGVQVGSTMVCQTLHYSTWIRRAENKGQLCQLYRNTKRGELRQIGKEIKSIVTAVCKAEIQVRKQKQKQKQKQKKQVTNE